MFEEKKKKRWEIALEPRNNEPSAKQQRYFSNFADVQFPID